MQSDLRDYVVSVTYDNDGYDSHHYIHFVTEYPVNSVGFWEDFYDICFNLLDDYSYNHFRIVEVEEGF